MRNILLATGPVIILALATAAVSAQASKRLEEKTKGMEQGQQKSWQQVDDINKETDKTKSRYQQSQQQGARAAQSPGSTLTKTRVGTATGHKKTTPARKTAVTKKKPPVR